MSIVSFNTLTPGLVGVTPRIVQLTTTDNLSTITTAGYLNRQGQVLQGFAFYPTDVVLVSYSFVVATRSGTFGIFLPTVSSNGTITLVQWIDSGNVLLPVVSGDFAVFNGTSGQIKDAGYLPSNPAKTNVVMATAATVANNLVMATDTAGTIGDSTIAASNVMLLSASNTMTGTGRIIAVKANGTEAANAVTASGMSGVITTSSLTTAGGSSYAITWTNTYIATTNVVLLTLMGGTNTTENITLKATAGSGTSTLTIYNNTAATALNGTILIGYTIL
jgi:hypothetical protein